MKKRLITASVAGLTAIVAGLSFAITANRGNFFKATNATTKTFTFDASVAKAQFAPNGFDKVEKSISTGGISDNLEVSVSMIANGGTSEQIKVFDDDDYFLRNGSTLIKPTYEIIIGVNNPTSVSVTYGMLKSENTTAEEIRCTIGSYKGDTYIDQTGSSGDAGINNDWTSTWTKPAEKDAGDNIRIKLEGLRGDVYWGEPLYIKSIVVTWSC